MTNNIIKYLFGPILLLQGKRVRKATPVLPEPLGDRRGIAGQGPDLRLLILGDSAAAGVGVDHQNQALLGQLVEQLEQDFTVHFTLIARSTATTRDTLKHLKKVKPKNYDVVVTSLGVNDVTSGAGIDRWLDHQRQLRMVIKQRFGTPWLFITSVPPMHQFPALPQPLRWYLGRIAAQFNRELTKAIAAEDRVAVLELDLQNNRDIKMATDGFHPGASAYTAWAQTAAKLIVDALTV